MIRRAHVSNGSPYIKYNDAPSERIGSTGENGTLNGRGRSGFVRRKTTTPIETMTNANSVPILTSWPSMEIGTSAAITATIAPVIIVVICGVLKRGCTFAAHDGSNPSLPIE